MREKISGRRLVCYVDPEGRVWTAHVGILIDCAVFPVSLRL